MQAQEFVRDLDVKLVVFQTVNRFGLIQLVPVWVIDCFLCSFIGAKLHNVSLRCARAKLKAGATMVLVFCLVYRKSLEDGPKGK